MKGKLKMYIIINTIVLCSSVHISKKCLSSLIQDPHGLGYQIKIAQVASASKIITNTVSLVVIKIHVKGNKLDMDQDK